MSSKAEDKAAEERGNKFRQEIRDKLVQGDIFAHMNKMRDMEEARYRYFHYCSDLWRAIQKHIVYAKDCVLIDRENSVMVHRGGFGVSLKRTHLYADDWRAGKCIPATRFCMEIEVEFVPEDEKDQEWPSTYRKYFDLQVPIALEQKFTQAAFDKWVDGIKAERDKEVREKELLQLKELQKKYGKKT